MKRYPYFLVFPLAISLIAYVVYSNTSKVYPPKGITLPTEKNIETSIDQIKDFSSKKESEFLSPLEKSQERVTKKPFGIYITPNSSPVQPERFQGFHTGIDFEIFPEELNLDIPVKAICSGELTTKKYAKGYGGVAVESCQINNQPITVVYGHLKISSLSKNIGEKIKSGDIIGLLGTDKSLETDGERKHLHLGIHKGLDINIKGYVENKTELSNWIDPCFYFCQNINRSLDNLKKDLKDQKEKIAS